MTIRIKVITHKLDMFASPEPIVESYESEKIIDHASASDRKWLGNHCFWAMRNGRRVTSYPL